MKISIRLYKCESLYSHKCLIFMVKSVKTFGIAQTKSDIVLLEEKGRQWI